MTESDVVGYSVRQSAFRRDLEHELELRGFHYVSHEILRTAEGLGYNVCVQGKAAPHVVAVARAMLEEGQDASSHRTAFDIAMRIQRSLHATCGGQAPTWRDWLEVEEAALVPQDDWNDPLVVALYRLARERMKTHDLLRLAPAPDKSLELPDNCEAFGGCDRSEVVDFRLEAGFYAARCTRCGGQRSYLPPMPPRSPCPS